MNVKRIFSFTLSLLFAFSLSTSVYSEPVFTEADGLLETVTDTVVSGTANDAPKIVAEVETLRGEYEKHFMLDNGNFMAVSYASPVNYQDADGNWHPIDNSLEAVENNGKRVIKNRDGLFDVEFAQNGSNDDLVSISKDDYLISWHISSVKETASILPIEPLPDVSVLSIEDETEIIDVTPVAIEENISVESELIDEPVIEDTAESTAEAEPVSETEPVMETEVAFAEATTAEIISASELTIDDEQSCAVPDETIAALVYNDAFENSIDLKYTLSSTSLKEDIILSSPSDISAYNIYMTTAELSPVLCNDNSIAFYNESNEIIFMMAAPYMYDATYAESYDIETALTALGNNQYLITITPNEEWLSSNERAYPITIDPSVSLQGSNSTNAIIDKFVCTASSSLSNYYMYLGTGYYDYNYSGSVYSYLYKTLIKLQKPLSLPSGASVTNAYLRLIAADISSTPPSLSISSLGKAWDEDTVTWQWTELNPGYTLSSATAKIYNGSTQPIYYYDLDLTEFATLAVKANYNFSTFHGFLIKRNSVDGYAMFYSSDHASSSGHPTFYVEYSRSSSLMQEGRYVFTSRVATPEQYIDTWYFIKKDGYWTIRNRYSPTVFLGYGSSQVATFTLTTEEAIDNAGDAILWSISVVSGTNYVRFHPKDYPTKAMTVPDGITNITASTKLNITTTNSTNLRQQWSFELQTDSYTFGAPVSLTKTWEMTSEWGYRVRSGDSSFHYGIDISRSGVGGDYIYAVADGIVSEVTNSYNNYGMGTCIDIEHFGMTNGNGGHYYSRYQHLKYDSILVEKDDMVYKGQPIAIIGSTGSNNTHLHFQIMNGNSRTVYSVNPTTLYHAYDSRSGYVNSNPVYFVGGATSDDDYYITFEANPNFRFTFDDDKKTDGYQYYGSTAIPVSNDYGYTGTDANGGASTGYWSD